MIHRAQVISTAKVPIIKMHAGRNPHTDAAYAVDLSGAFYLTLVPIRPRRRGERRSLRTFPGASLRPGSLAFNPDTPRRLSTPLLTPFKSTPTFARMDPQPSVGAVNGLDAVAWIKRQCETFPALRPLVLTLKRLLKTHALDDASTGGCGGYLLVSLAVSHLRLSGDAGKASPGNLGALLLGFLRRFGNDFDYARTAVAAGRASGVLSAKELVVHPGAFGRRPVILCEDPQARLLRVFASPQFFLPQPKINSRPGPERRRSARLCDDVAMI